jgi:hypothetical protein
MGKKGDQPGQSLRKPNWDLNRLMPFQKNFYVETPAVANRSEASMTCIRRAFTCQ